MDISNLEKWHFEMTEDAANYMLKLVLEGNKRATASSLWGYQNEETIPREGEISVITWWDGTPGCIVKTTKVRIILYRDMTFDVAKLEGEDSDLESWQKNHKAFWLEEGSVLGYVFSEDMPIVFEEFEILEILNRNPIGK